MHKMTERPATPRFEALIDPYTGCLRKQSYKDGVIAAYSVAIEHFAGWLAGTGRSAGEVQESVIGEFLDLHLPVCGCPGRLQRSRSTMRAALGHLVRFLRADGVIAPKSSGFPSTVESELLAFTGYLRDVCGLAPNTVISRRQWAGRVLAHLFPDRAIDIQQIEPRRLGEFMRSVCSGFEPGTVKVVGNAMRSYLRFRAVRFGDPVECLIAAVPAVALWRLATLPKHLSDEDVERLLGTFDRQRPEGMRDYAMARCAADLGLRTSEIAALRLDDVNWREGYIAIDAGKSRRASLLPLPASTGQAIAAYLRDGRPPSVNRQIFVRHQAPLDKPVGTELVRSALRRALDRCGLADRFTSPHVLRHTVATRLINQGVSRKQIADLLRHRSLDTTAIYAKVDVGRLSRLTQPWPGGAR